MYLHPTYAVSPEREPLGVLDAWMWVRDAPKKACRSQAAGAKESCRWLEEYVRLAEQAGFLPDTRLVYVAGRKRDFPDWMVQASALDTPVDWLIRSADNRKLVGQQAKLCDGFAQAHGLEAIHFDTLNDSRYDSLIKQINVDSRIGDACRRQRIPRRSLAVMVR
jgi:hypothetical protein